MKCLHAADIHIREKDIVEIETCLNFLVETAAKENVDLVIIAGDIFDSQEVKMASRSARLAVKTISALADIAPVAIIKCTDSHDGNAPEILSYARGRFSVYVATMPQQILLADGILCATSPGKVRAVLTLIPQPSKQFFQTRAGIEGADQEIGQAMSALFGGFGAQAAVYPGVPHILAGHWNVNGCRLANGQIRTGMDIEVSVDQMNLGNFDIGCLGHIHVQQVLGGRYFYSGPIYATKIDEDGPKGFYVHDLDTLSGVWESRFIETPCKKMVRLSHDLTPVLTETEKSDLYYHEHGEVAGAHVRLDLTIWQDEAGTLDKQEIEKHYLSLGAESADIRIIRVPRVTVRAESVLKAETLPDKIARMAEIRGEIVSAGVLVKAAEIENAQPAG